MKFRFLTTALFFVALCSSVSVFAQYDDLYYNPKTDYDYYYGTTATKEEESNNFRNENQSGSGLKKPQTKEYAYGDANNNDYYDNDDDEYYYSKRIRRFHRSYNRFDYGFWDNPWYDSYGYGYAPTSSFNVYYGFGWNRWNRWNSFNSWNYNPYAYDPWGYNSFYGCGNGWNNGWNGYGFGNTYVNNYYGYNSPYGYNNHYYNNNNGQNGNWYNTNNGATTTSNPKGTYNGVRNYGGASNPAPPVKIGREGNTSGTTTTNPSRTPRSLDPSSSQGVNTGTEATTSHPNRWRTETATQQPQSEVRTFDESNSPNRTDRSNVRYQETPRSTPRNSDNNNERTYESRPQRSYSPPARSNEEDNSSRSRSYKQPRSTPSRSQESSPAPSRSHEQPHSSPAPSRSYESPAPSNNSGGGGRSSGGRGRN